MTFLIPHMQTSTPTLTKLLSILHCDWQLSAPLIQQGRHRQTAPFIALSSFLPSIFLPSVILAISCSCRNSNGMGHADLSLDLTFWTPSSICDLILSRERKSAHWKMFTHAPFHHTIQTRIKRALIIKSICPVWTTATWWWDSAGHWCWSTCEDDRWWKDVNPVVS